MSVITNLQTRISALITEISRNQAELAAAERAGRPVLVTDALRETIARQQQELSDLRTQLTAADQQASLGTASAGQVVAQEAQAKANNAATSNPTASVTVTSITDEELQARLLETGTNGRVRPLVETQATPATPQQPDLIGESYAVPGVLSTSPGVGANREDNTAPNTNQAQNLVNATFNQPIRPQDNVLDNYASYTYALSWYLLTPEQYAALMGAGSRSIANWQLLMQSGGAPTQVGDGVVGGRNQSFPLDFYMDNLEIDTLCTLKGTGTAHSALSLRFTVTEPNGLTLIENLYTAIKNLYSQLSDGSVPTNVNYAMAMHCMVIRFYGYDDAGNLVKVGRRGTNSSSNASDPSAVIEKYYPFIVTNINFKNANRLIEYRVEGVPQGYNYGFGTNRGTIPYNFELAGRTVKDLLKGSAATAPPTDANRPTTVQPATTIVEGPPDPGYAVDENGQGLS